MIQKTALKNVFILLCVVALILCSAGCTNKDIAESSEPSSTTDSSEMQSSDETESSEQLSSDASSSETTESEPEPEPELEPKPKPNPKPTPKPESNPKPAQKPKPEPQIPSRPKLPLITPDGDDMAYHPSVVKFDSEWNGYKYWIAFTPYPRADETKENPVINVSNDMKTWYVPSGLKNPLDKPDPSDRYHYNSDTHMLYNPTENRLELFWRYICDDGGKIGTVTIFRSVSYDGVTWEPKTVFLFVDDRNVYDYVSPAITLQDNVYRMWYVDVDKKAYYAEIVDGVIGEPTLLNVPFQGKLVPWHLDVIYNSEKAIYEMIVSAYTNRSDRQTMSMFYTYSSDNLNWSEPKAVILPSDEKNKWDSRGMYRACMLYNNGTYYVFFSAHGPNKTEVGVGLMYGSDIYDLKSYI